ncbi:MAG TPA: TonB-dependent receptor [Microscillaceae bacterium]|nr:TonB-dependent receptor [Microscillaceae bacterium]
MKILFVLIAFIGLANVTFAQTSTTVQGKVLDDKGKPVPFTNVYLKEIFDGGVTDDEGRFSFVTQATGKAILTTSFVGYKAFEQEIMLNGQPLTINPVLKPSSEILNPVSITAGAFEASDEKKAVILKPLDIVTTAGADGDIYGALRTLPGVSPANDETGIFVRGGEAYETKTIIDGTIVLQPFFSSVPDVPARGRFNPFQFKGTTFSTGGYSAEYGQALSSVLLLNSQDLPSRSNYSASITAAGIGATRTQLLNENTAILGSVGYSNLNPLFAVNRQNQDWQEAPIGYGGTIGFRHKDAQGGMYKTQVQYQYGDMAVRFPNLDPGTPQTNFRNKNENIYLNSSYRGGLGKKWFMYAGVSYSRDGEFINIDGFEVDNTETLMQAKVTLSRDITSDISIKFGGELHQFNGDVLRRFVGGSFDGTLLDNYGAAYVETDFFITKRFAGRVGLRLDRSQLLDDTRLSPRASLAYKTGQNSQVSVAYGQFYQTPEPEFLYQADPLDFEQATHYILNYQWMIANQRTFRVETYYKRYESLIKNQTAFTYNNDGTGFSQGVDVFWRDQKTVKNLDYWLSYSYIKARRNYRNYPQEATPDFAPEHTLSAVIKYQIKSINTRLGMTYAFAAGRTYFNPNNDNFLSDRTPHYHNFNVNLSHNTSIAGNFTVIFASVNNPFGIDQILDYRYSSNGQTRIAIKPSALRSFFIGMFISFR